MSADINGRQVLIEVRTRSTVTPQDVDRLVQGALDGPAPAKVVVANRVVAAAREALRAAGWGWLDRRGHLRVDGPGVLLEVDVSPSFERPAPRDPLSGGVALEVATWILAHPDSSPGVRELARKLDRAASSVSEAFKRLGQHGLVTEDLAPIVPELFWETAERWATPRQALRTQPRPGDNRLTERLELGLERVGETTGWALTDTVAAAAYGAPVGIGSESAPDFLVPSRDIERLARMILGAASGQDRACTVRVAPARWACARRVDAVAIDAATHWPLVHPLFVALDLASDPGRGREILDSWTLPHPWHRVW